MTPEEYQALIDAGWTPEEIQALGVAPATGGTPQEPAGPTPSSPQRPAGVSDWAWGQYLAMSRDYDEVWNDLKRSEGWGTSDPVLQARANNAASLLAKAKATVDDEVAASMKSGGSDPEDIALKRRLLAAQVASAERGPVGAQWRPGEYDYQLLQNKKLEQDLLGEPTGYQKAMLEYTKQQDAISNQQKAQQLQQQRLQDSWQMAAGLLNAQRQAAPYARIPGQTHFVGYEPGGIMSNIARLSGRTYNPDQYKAPIINYDPNQAWQAAAQAMGGNR